MFVACPFMGLAKVHSACLWLASGSKASILLAAGIACDATLLHGSTTHNITPDIRWASGPEQHDMVPTALNAQAGDRVAALTAAVDELSSLEHYVRTTKPTRQHATMLTVRLVCLLHREQCSAQDGAA